MVVHDEYSDLLHISPSLVTQCFRHSFLERRVRLSLQHRRGEGLNGVHCKWQSRQDTRTAFWSGTYCKASTEFFSPLAHRNQADPRPPVGRYTFAIVTYLDIQGAIDGHPYQTATGSCVPHYI